MEILIDHGYPLIVASIVQPPSIVEINLRDIYNPYVVKVYKIDSDADTYIGLNVLDIDSKYIVA